MAVKSVLQRAARRFAGDRRGNYGMMMAVLAPMLFLGVGFGINIAQVSTARSNLLAALDSAVTSTARDLTTGTIEETEARGSVEAFLFANGQRAFSEGDRITLDSIVIDKTKKTVAAQASVVVDVAFPLFGASNQQKITTESAAVYSDRKIEVAMMLDLTGSMKKTWTDDKLGDLQKAAKNAVSKLLAYNKGANPRVRIALVPYANAVNVGKSIAQASVFVERSMAEREQAPSSNDPKLVLTAPRPDYCATERKGADQYNDNGPASSMVNRDYLLDGHSNRKDYLPSVTCPATAMVPLTTSQTTLDAAIDSFVADGGTAGHIGVQWTWYMLSERWASVVGTSAAPAKADSRKVGKYAILMTDGEFNLSYFDVADAPDAYNPSGKAKTRESATTLCAAMRKAGIEIFTIGFKLNDEKAKETMRSCASPDTPSIQHYFDTSTGSELDAAFQKIVENLERLALTK